MGLVGDKIVCLSCNRPKYKYDTEMILSLPLVGASVNSSTNYGRSNSYGAPSLLTKKSATITFDDMLQKFFEVEILPKTETLKCSNCRTLRQVSKQTEIFSLPKILIIHLKRFIFSERVMDFEKCNDRVSIKQRVQITCQQEGTVGNYDLYGIVHHYGTKNNGHYTR